MSECWYLLHLSINVDTLHIGVNITIFYLDSHLSTSNLNCIIIQWQRILKLTILASEHACWTLVLLAITILTWPKPSEWIIKNKSLTRNNNQVTVCMDEWTPLVEVFSNGLLTLGFLFLVTLLVQIELQLPRDGHPIL